MKILNFGSCNIDYVYSLDHIVNAGETLSSLKLEVFPGGKGLNQSIAAARAGLLVCHAGCIGNDGEMLLDIMKESGVDISCIKRVDEKNGHAVIQVSCEGENSIFLFAGSNQMVTEDYIDSVLEKFTEEDIVLLQNEISNIEYIINKAYEKNMRIVLNPSPMNEKILSLDFNMLSYIILNEIEAKAITGYDDVAMILNAFRRKYPKLKLMLTLGKNGCVYMDSEMKITRNSYSVKAVDTTAAGDTFTGYFLAGISKELGIDETLRLASAASAITVSRSGAAPSIPVISEVTDALLVLKENIIKKDDEYIRQETERYIINNIQSASLDELAEILGYSAVYTGNIVKKLTGKTFSKLLQEKRCSVAAKLLCETDMSVKEIINTVGYENESYFREIFKERYGKKLLEYRKGN